MSLIELLELNGDRLPHRTRGTVRYLEARWREWGAPAEAQDLERFLDEGLRFCKEAGMLYPKAVFKRLKQLQRAEWAPASKVAP